MRRLSGWLVLALAVSVALPGWADDGAASIAAGGLVLMKREQRIVMAKEVLRISTSRVVVEYEFRNDSDQNITTEVAFPIPAYLDDPDGPRAELSGFDDFRLWVDGKPVKFQVEARAFVGKREITGLLASMHMDAASFGHEFQDKDGNVVNDLRRLSRTQRVQLAAFKAIQGVDDVEPN